MDSHQGSLASKGGVRKYCAYQGDIYFRGMFNNVIPTVTTDPNKLEIQAKERMSKDGFNYVAGGAGERATMDANRLAFRQWKVHTRLLLLHMNLLPWRIMLEEGGDPFFIEAVFVRSFELTFVDHPKNAPRQYSTKLGRQALWRKL